MELHNIVEDIVISDVTDIFNTIEEQGNPKKYCICWQCRLDTACYVLNRSSPQYIVSNRGASRVDINPIKTQQTAAEITSLIYEGLKKVNHNQRPNADHSSSSSHISEYKDKPVFQFPTITGRLFDGTNFSPISDVNVQLLYNGKAAEMKDNNWQNPLNLVSHTNGTFTFWPAPIPAKKIDEHASFEFTIQIETKEYDTLNHIFRVPVISEILTKDSFSLMRSFKLPDLFMFPPGANEKNLYIND